MFDLNFEEDEEGYLEACFEEIKKFRDTEAVHDDSYERSDGWLNIHISCYETEYAAQYKNALEYFFTHQKEVLDALCKGFLEEYPKLMELYGETAFDDTFFPELNDINDVKKHLAIHTLHIHEKGDDIYGTIGFECECPWDPEHGAGIVMHKDTFVIFGGADRAFSGLE
ncbi:hypothetical protein [uncultured Kordia sp.]|uniref:DUF6985 domain-containing protein n=1 Tax=uncultured Kordia sp. TaxID=507699 RepID=UPI00262A6BE6|nr:hypothetical protein [uncultured Kordia sp.]